MDMDYIPKEKIIEKASEKFEGAIEGYELQFFGKCKDCLSIKKQNII